VLSAQSSRRTCVPYLGHNKSDYDAIKAHSTHQRKMQARLPEVLQLKAAQCLLSDRWKSHSLEQAVFLRLAMAYLSSVRSVLQLRQAPVLAKGVYDRAMVVTSRQERCSTP
jgi:hypothetical protein